MNWMWRFAWFGGSLVLAACGVTSSVTKLEPQTIGRDYRVAQLSGTTKQLFPFTTVNYIKLGNEGGKLKVCAAYRNTTSRLFATDAEVARLYHDVNSYIQVGDGQDALRISTDFFNAFPYSPSSQPTDLSGEAACVLTGRAWSDALAMAPVSMRLYQTQYTVYRGRTVLHQTPP